MPLHRFVIFWIIDYLLAMGVVFVISTAGPAVLGLEAMRELSLLFIPINTLFFSWLAYRGLARESAHRWIVASLWIGAALLIDSVSATLFWHLPPLIFLSNPLVFGTYGMKFIAVFVGAYLGLQPSARLEAASTLSPDLLPPAQG